MRLPAVLLYCLVAGCPQSSSSPKPDFAGVDFAGLDLTGVDLAGFEPEDLAGRDLSAVEEDMALDPNADLSFPPPPDGADLATGPFDLSDPCAGGGCTCPGGCLGGACVSGKCQPASVRPGQALPYGVAVDDTWVYWCNFTGNMVNGTVWKQLKSGGDPVQIASGQWGPRHVRVLGGRAFFDNFYAGTVMTVLPGATSALQVHVIPGQLRYLVIDDGHVYFLQMGSAAIRRVPGDGGTEELLVSPTNQDPIQIASDGSRLFWTNVAQLNVSSAPVGGGDAGIVTTPPAAPSAIAIDATTVYFSAGKLIYKVAKSGGTSIALDSTLMARNASALAVDTTHVYWADYTGGFVGRVPIAGGANQTLASSQPYPAGIAVDDEAVYWANQGTTPNNGEIRRLKK